MTKVNRQPHKSANRATNGMLIAEVSTIVLAMPPMAWARLAWEMTSEITPTDVGAIAPPPRPTSTLSAINTSIFGANADARRDAVTRNTPESAIGRRPMESARGPTTTMETAHAAKVTVANWPATATETSNSLAISTRSAGTIITPVMVPKTTKQSRK